MNEIEKFTNEVENSILLQGSNELLKTRAEEFMDASIQSRYSYNFTWMGRPIIQYPQDMVAMQELIWNIKPDLIIETGIAHGGSIIYYASLLELIGKGEVLGIDIDIRQHNRNAIESHAMYKRIHMIEGSSIAEETIKQVEKFAANKQTVLVTLDSNHTHDHVLEELKLYSNFVTLNSYLVVFDTIVEFLPENQNTHSKRPWGIGDNPMTAVNAFITENPQFEIDKAINNKLLISVAPDGYLKRTK